MPAQWSWMSFLTGLVLGVIAWPVGYWILGTIVSLNIGF
jgi:hypothetical protein